MSSHKEEMEEAEAWGRSEKPRQLVKRGRQHLRAKQVAATKQAISVRLDQDVVERLKALAGPQGSYQSLMNRALVQWCDAQEEKGLLEQKLERLEDLVGKLERMLEAAGKDKSVA